MDSEVRYMEYYEYSHLKDVIRDLEYIVSSKCNNIQYTNKISGSGGRQYRYPVNYFKEGKKYICRGKISVNDPSAEQEIKSMRYEFGSNHLYIGKAIVEILDYLKDRYDLDFYDLERDYKMFLDE